MSIQSDIVAALASVASGKVYPEAAPADIDLPLVVYRRTAYEPVMNLGGYSGLTRSVFTFECWGVTKAEAQQIASALKDAIVVAFPKATHQPTGGEEYEPAVDEFVEPVAFGFWHA